MVRTVWAATSTGRRLYLVDASLAFIPPVKQYLDYLAALEKSPHTLEHYCRHLKHLFTFLEERQREWDDVTPDDIVQFMQWLRTPRPSAAPAPPQSPRTERTVNTILTAVSSFYRYHVQRGTILTHPLIYDQVPTRFSSFKPFLVHFSRGTTLARALKLKEPRKRVKTISDTEFQRFFQATDNLQFRCMLLLMRQGGLRVGEVLGLLIQDLEFHRNGVWVRRRAGLANGALAKGLTAGEARFVDLPPSVMALLDHLLLQHTFDTDHLFVVRQSTARDAAGQPTYGSPLDHAAVKALFRHYSRKSGVTLHAHMLRHTHATELIRAGWDASYVQKRLGHAHVQTTLNTYVHLTDEDLTQKWRAYLEAHHDDTR
jgi:integrase/recombinase XerD